MTPERILALLAAARAACAGVLPSVFGHMRLRAGEKESDILLGTAKRLAPEVSIIDWQTAPLAEVFFAHEEGEDYAIESDGREIEGRLLEKHLLSFREGELVLIDSERGAIEKRGDTWIERPRAMPRFVPRDEAKRTPFRSPLEVELDPAQRQVVDLPAGRRVLVLGEAGFGKTTVALHRLAALAKRGQHGWRAAVIVPSEGLRRLTNLVLERRRVKDVQVWTFDRWAGTVARHAFRDLPARESVSLRAGVLAVKRSRALRSVLAEYVEARRGSARGRQLAKRADLHHLFGDTAWIEKVFAAANGTIRRTAIEEVAEHTRVQFRESTETAYAHLVDPERLETLDGRRIDEGTSNEDAESVDVEDYAVMFEIDRLRAEKNGAEPASLPKYDCVVVDEAQELAALELALVGRAVKRGGDLVVAGDGAQQVDPTSGFEGWERVMEDLGAADYEKSILEVSYRCPPEVTALARSVLDPALPREEAPSIVRRRHESALHLRAWLVSELRAIEAVDPSASIAVTCRTRAVARSMASTLKHGLDVQLALDGDFVFRPGVLVTCVPEVKGLEFDYVVVPDADAATYPDQPESRRALYVAVTRATHRLVLACTGSWTPLVQDSHTVRSVLSQCGG